MEKALKGMPLKRFVAPSNRVVRGDAADLPPVSGKSPDEAANVLRQAGFDVVIADEWVDSPEAEGTVAYTDPRSRDGAPEGSLVTIHVSNGHN
jgi:beta-lactam-binding protein with PASTA domain